MGKAEENQDSMRKIETKPKGELFEDIPEKDLEKAYKEDMEDEKEEEKEKWRKAKDSVTEEDGPTTSTVQR